MEHERIANRCPACGNQTLFIGGGGWLTCSWLQCPNPCVSDYLDLARALLCRDLTVVEVAGFLHGFQQLMAGDREPMERAIATVEAKSVAH